MTPGDLVLTPMGLRHGGLVYPCTVGRGGVRTHKREGDGATPTGVHRITGMLFRPDRIARPAPWARPIGPRDLWCDDPAHPAYNRPVRTPFGASHERLRRADRLYDLVLLTDWNWPYAVKGRGSAIFIHRWRKPGHPTEGCIGLRTRDLDWIVPRIRYETRLVVR